MSSRNTCSYCRREGHDIRTCDHPIINHNIQRMKHRYQLYYSSPYQSAHLLRRLFTCYLSNYSADHIRAVVVHLRIGTTSLSKSHGIQRICDYFEQQSNIIVPYSNVQAYEGNWISNYREQPTNIQWTAPPTVQNSVIKMNFVSSSEEKITNAFDCPICLDTINEEEGVKLNCSHIFCSTCISQVVKLNTHDVSCAVCRENISVINVTSNKVCEQLKTCGNRIQLA